MARPRQGDEPYTMLSIRFPEWMVEAIDSHLHAMHSTTPMVTLSRSDAVRDLVFRALHTPTATDATPDTPRRPSRPVGRAPRASKGVGDAA